MKNILIFVLLLSVIVSAQDVVPGVVVVKVKDNPPSFSLQKKNSLPVANLKQKIQTWQIKQIEQLYPQAKKLDDKDVDLSKIYEVQFSSNMDPVSVAASFQNEANVEYAEPLYVERIFYSPNDPQYNSQAFLQTIQAAQAWDIVKGGEEVIIGIVDSGVDWDHEDLRDNIWQNLGEDADGDGHTIEFIDGKWQLDPGDLNGVDDDNHDFNPNTFIDDLIGWDFVGASEENIVEDNDPDVGGGHYHGTHVAGLASAVTDNGKGIAGTGFNCKLMVSKHGPERSDALTLYNPYAAIKYMTDAGADIINCSWGGATYSKYGQDIIDYAYARGVLVVAAAGNNDGSSSDGKIYSPPETPPTHYPAGYEHVLSVANSRVTDEFSSGSFWGPTVDITCPGTNVLSTLKNNNYGRTTGTSMSSPITAGVAGLVKSLYPDWNPDQISMQLIKTADDISGLYNNDDYIYAGGIGSGRINAYQAVAPENQNRPNLALDKVVLLDENDNGKPEPGEIVDIIVGITNDWADAPNLTATLECDDPSVEILNGTVSFPFLYGYSAVGFNFTDNAAQPFQIKLPQTEFARLIPMRVVVQNTSGFSQTLAIDVPVKPVILLVDDDSGRMNEKFYMDTFRELELPYVYWNQNRQGFPKNTENYPLIVWLTEWDYPTLSSTDRNVIEEFVNDGKAIYVAGQRIAQDLCKDGPSNNQYRLSLGQSQTFHQQVLKAELLNDVTSHIQVNGKADDVIGDGISFEVVQPNRLQNEISPPELQAVNGGESFFSYPNGQTAAVRYAGDYRSVYTAFGGLESMPDDSLRNLFMQRVYAFLSGFGWTITPAPDIENTSLENRVEVTFQSTAPIAKAVLFYKKSTDTNFTAVDMSMNDDAWIGVFPAQALGTAIEYFVYAEDESGFFMPKILYEFRVDADEQAPVITANDKVVTTLSNVGPFSFAMNARDNGTLNKNSARLHYGYELPLQNVIEMQFVDEDRFQTELDEILVLGDTLYYQFSISDSSAAENVGESNVLKLFAGYESFETGLDDWITSQGGWGLDEYRAVSGAFSMHSNPGIGNPYPDNANLKLTFNKDIDLSVIVQPFLSFQQLYGLLPGDSGFVEISTNGGESWEMLTEVIGAQAAFQETIIPLGAFQSEQVRLQFRLQTDAAAAGPGWYVDDIQILNMPSSVTTEAQFPTEFILSDNYPNPFNPTTRLEFAVPHAAMIRIDIYDILGRHVRTLVHEQKTPGFYQMNWDARNDFGQSVAGGLYFYRLSADGFSQVKKMLFLK